jgi:hypothetical protein
MSCVYVDWLLAGFTYWNKLKVNSASCWLLLYGYVMMHGQQNTKIALLVEIKEILCSRCQYQSIWTTQQSEYGRLQTKYCSKHNSSIFAIQCCMFRYNETSLDITLKILKTYAISLNNNAYCKYTHVLWRFHKIAKSDY